MTTMHKRQTAADIGFRSSSLGGWGSNGHLALSPERENSVYGEILTTMQRSISAPPSNWNDDDLDDNESNDDKDVLDYSTRSGGSLFARTQPMISSPSSSRIMKGDDLFGLPSVLVDRGASSKPDLSAKSTTGTATAAPPAMNFQYGGGSVSSSLETSREAANVSPSHQIKNLDASNSRRRFDVDRTGTRNESNIGVSDVIEKMKHSSINNNYESILNVQSAAPILAPPGVRTIEHNNNNDNNTFGKNSSFLLDMDKDRYDIIGSDARRPVSTGIIGGRQAQDHVGSLLSSTSVSRWDNLSPPPGSNANAVNSQSLQQQQNQARIHDTSQMHHQQSTAAVRPAPKTLMELIQENFPKTTSPSAQQKQHYHQGEISQGRGSVITSARQLQHTKPCSSHTQSSVAALSSAPVDAGYVHHSSLIPSSHSKSSPSATQTTHHVAHLKDNDSLQHQQYSHHVAQHQHQHSSINTSYSHPVHSMYDGSSAASQVMTPTQHAGAGQYAAISPHSNVRPGTSIVSQQGHQVYGAHVHPQHHQMHVQHQPYEMQTVYYGSPQRIGEHGQVVSHAPQPHHTSPAVHVQQAHPIYLNGAPYYPMQYAPINSHHVTQHTAGRPLVVHQPPPQQYISVMPVPTATNAQPQQVVNGGYTTTYWQTQDPRQGVAVPQPASVTVAHSTPHAAESLTKQRRGKSGGNNGSGKAEKTVKKRTGRKVGSGADQLSSKQQGGTGGGIGSSSGNEMLEELRNSKNRNWVMSDIKGHIVEFSQDQNGSRFIQQRLESSDASEKQLVMDEVLPEVKRLRNDVFGNYVVQKLLEHGTDSIKEELKNTLVGEMMPLSLQMYGCRVVQKALETLDKKFIPCLLAEFAGNIIPCIQDQNGNHVIQKCVEVMSRKAKAGDTDASAQIQFVVDDVLENVASLSCHPYGCRVLQRILEHCVDPVRTRALNEILKCHRELLDDQYGNYVIQHVLQFGREVDRDSILRIVVEGGLLVMSRQKFASNVVEKLLQYGSAGQRNTVVREMLKPNANNQGHDQDDIVVLLMVRDAYANYVVQTALDVVAEGEEKVELLKVLYAHSEQLRNYTFAKHIVAKLCS
mmetsp:Transcript_4804/g.5821  ORF Transcript_4804/g.5821 Transcript_4804/m.5821 type:complete len:1087 (-) Transcript_4804:496-3756(-)